MVYLFFSMTRGIFGWLRVWVGGEMERWRRGGGRWSAAVAAAVVEEG